MASSLPGSNQRWGAACVQIRLLSALAIVTLVLPPQCVGYNNGLGRLPALGWNGWCTDGPCQRDVCYEKTVLEIADAMISSGMHKLGWEYINLDDCWGSTERAPDGSLQANATRFPSGIPSLAKQIHDKGLKLGLYTASGTTWCMHPWMQDGDRHIPGMWGHYAQDVATLVSFDIDYLKCERLLQHAFGVLFLPVSHTCIVLPSCSIILTTRCVVVLAVDSQAGLVCRIADARWDRSRSV